MIDRKKVLYIAIKYSMEAQTIIKYIIMQIIDKLFIFISSYYQKAINIFVHSPARYNIINSSIAHILCLEFDGISNSRNNATKLEWVEKFRLPLITIQTFFMHFNL